MNNSSSPTDPIDLSVDAVIVGGGVAALWTANALRAKDYSVILLTNSPLGEGQSLAAQGVIHGGLKYAVGGKLTDSSEALAGMPGRWLDALAGRGEIDLSSAELLSDHQIMWSLPSVVSQVVGFFGSKAVRGRAGTVDREDYPEIFATDAYRGKLFRVEEPVIDPVGAIRALAGGVAENSYLIDWEKNAEWEIADGTVQSIFLTGASGARFRIEADRFVLAAGAGNGPILKKIGLPAPEQQLRPLHQLIIRKEGLPDFYSICVGNTPKPPLVSTTHRDEKGRTIWYIGGDIAEKAGVERSEDEQIVAGKDLFSRLLPWVDLEGAEWFTWRGNRAEPHTGTGDRPAGAFCQTIGNLSVTWPTKLALAPHLADQVASEMEAPNHATPPALDLPCPEVGRAPWDLP